MCAGVGSGNNFRKVPEGSSVCRCRFWTVPVCACVRFRRQLPEGSGGFRLGSGGNFRKAPEECWCRFRRQLPEGSGGFRRVPVFRKVQESSGGFVALQLRQEQLCECF